MTSHSPKSKTNATVRGYLVGYNIFSALGWSYILFVVSTHLAGLTGQALEAPPTSSLIETPFLMRILGAVQSQPQTPSVSHFIFDRARTTFIAVGWQTAVIQSFATLEVIHTLLGWVRSPVATTAMQVASRLILVWGIAERYETARFNPIYSSMVLAWSITEVIRYSFYAVSMLQREPRWLLWLRYNTFFVLYPIGAGSEAALTFSTLPFQRRWNVWDYGRATMFLIWWPGLYVMYTYMIKQRKKVFGSKTVNHCKVAKVN